MKYSRLLNLRRENKSEIRKRLDIFLWDAGLKDIDVDSLYVSNSSIRIPDTDFSIQFKLSYICPWEEGLFVSEIRIVGNNRSDIFSFSLGSTVSISFDKILNAIKNNRIALLSSLRELSDSCISQFIRRLPEKVFNFLSTKDVHYKSGNLSESIILGGQITFEVDKDNRTVRFLLMKVSGKRYNNTVKLNNFKKGLRLFIKELENEI